LAAQTQSLNLSLNGHTGTIGEENITNVELTQDNPADLSLITLSKEGLKDR